MSGTEVCILVGYFLFFWFFFFLQGKRIGGVGSIFYCASRSSLNSHLKVHNKLIPFKSPISLWVTGRKEEGLRFYNAGSRLLRERCPGGPIEDFSPSLL